MSSEYDFSGGRRGPVVRSVTGKTRITIRLDDDLVEWFRQRADESGGGNYQTMINDALREHVSIEPRTLEETLRRVVREEMARVAHGEGTTA